MKVDDSRQMFSDKLSFKDICFEWKHEIIRVSLKGHTIKLNYATSCWPKKYVGQQELQLVRAHEGEA